MRPFDASRVHPYVRAGIGSFTAHTASDARTVNGLTMEDRRLVTDLATNVGAGVLYRRHLPERGVPPHARAGLTMGRLILRSGADSGWP